MVEDNRQAFLRGVLREDRAIADGAGFRLARGGTQLSRQAALALAAEGALILEADGCRPGPQAREWLRRAALGRTSLSTPAPVRLPDDSPLARLAQAGSGEAAAFLSPHHVAAGERFRLMFDRAGLTPRLTMTYDPTRLGGQKGRGGGVAEIGERAADTRRRLNALLSALPADCAGVVLDVCGLGKGMQAIETERGWPRRSAKLVLRIGLEHLAGQMGLMPSATGESRGFRTWLGGGARPARFE